jgi:hypothetical protein
MPPRSEVIVMTESGSVRSRDELLAVDYITADELRKLHVTAVPLPPEHEIEDAECHNCGEPWNGGEDWDESHYHGGASAGEDWKYTCPNCGFQTFEVGT